jgi:hypothetical protein
MNRLKEFKNDIKLPSMVAIPVINNKEITMISVWLSLKSMYAAGVILNYQNRLKEIADHSKICVKTLKKYLKEIISENLAFEDGKSLVLRTKNILLNRYAIKLKSKFNQYNSFNVKSAGEIRLCIRAQAIKDNQYKQSAFLNARMNQRLQTVVKSEAVKYRKIQRAVHKQSFNTIHAGIKQSQQTVATIYGCKSKSSGHYWTRKLEMKKLLNVKRQEPTIIMKGVTLESFRHYRFNFPEFKGYFFKGTIYKYLPNELRVIF